MDFMIAKDRAAAARILRTYTQALNTYLSSKSFDDLLKPNEKGRIDGGVRALAQVRKLYDRKPTARTQPMSPGEARTLANNVLQFVNSDGRANVKIDGNNAKNAPEKTTTNALRVGGSVILDTELSKLEATAQAFVEAYSKVKDDARNAYIEAEATAQQTVEVAQ